MMSVTICGSMKFASEMVAWQSFLQEQGVVAYAPDVVGNDKWNNASDQEQRVLAKRLAESHFSIIMETDTVFIFNQDGYTGPSVTLEMGFAAAYSKPIYALCKDTNEVCRDVWFDGYCATKVELLAVLMR